MPPAWIAKLSPRKARTKARKKTSEEHPTEPPTPPTPPMPPMPPMPSIPPWLRRLSQARAIPIPEEMPPPPMPPTWPPRLYPTLPEDQEMPPRMEPWKDQANQYRREQLFARTRMERTEENEAKLETLKHHCKLLLIIAKGAVATRCYLDDEEERADLEYVADIIKEMYEKYDEQFSKGLLGIKCVALRLIESRKLPPSIQHVSSRRLEKIRDRPWFQIQEAFEREHAALEKWMEKVALANAEHRKEPKKPSYVTTTLFLAAANDCGCQFAALLFAIKQYAVSCKICHVQMFPDFADMMLHNIEALIGSMTILEIGLVNVMMIDWLAKWHPERCD